MKIDHKIVKILIKFYNNLFSANTNRKKKKILYLEEKKKKRYSSESQKLLCKLLYNTIILHFYKLIYL